MQIKSRTYNSIFNSAIGIVCAVFNIALNFLVRIVLVRALGEEINGLHSLFQNIISILAIVETSMCTAMIIHLYEPVTHNDVNGLSKILSFYNKVYLVLAAGFFIIGLLLNVCINFIIETDIPISNVRFYFFVFILSIVVNYLTYTYRVVLFAEQKNRISSICTLFAEIIFRGLAAVGAILLHSYTFFLVSLIGEKFFGNILCRYFVRRNHPGITCMLKGNDGNLDLRGKIMRTVKPLMISRIADIVQNSSQGILISLLLGNIAVVGYYGNYALVVGAVGLLYSQIGASFTSSFGNLSTEKDSDKMYQAYRKSDFVMTSGAIVVCAGFIACIQDFIALAFGSSFLLSNEVVGILTITMYVTLINIPVISVQNATGRHDADFKNMIIQACCSLFGGFIGGYYFGMVGLLSGMLLPLVIFTTVVKAIIIHKEIFIKNTTTTFKQLAVTFFKGIMIVSLTFFAVGFIDTDVYLINIIIKGLISVVISVTGICILSINDSNLKSTLRLLMNIFKCIKS